jgi:hypothetical protein
VATTTSAPSGPARPLPPRWATPVALVGAGVFVAFGAVRTAASGEARPLVGALGFAGVVLALMVPLHLMQRSGRGVAAPMGTSESRWSMVAFSGVQVVAAGAGAVWAAGAGHTGFAVALGGWAVFCLGAVVGARGGPPPAMSTTAGERARAYFGMPTSASAFLRGMVLAVVMLTVARLLGWAIGLEGFGWDLVLAVAVAVVFGLCLRVVQARRPPPS